MNAQRSRIAKIFASLLLIVSTPGAGHVPAGPSGIVVQQGARITLTVTNMSVREVLFKLSNAFNVNIAVTPDVRGSVTVRLSNARLDDALSVVLAPLGIPYQRYGSSIVVGRAGPSPGSAMSYVRSAPASARIAPASLAAITLVHADALRVAADLRAENPGMSVAAGPDNTIIANVTPDKLAQIQSYVAGIDGPAGSAVPAIYVAANQPGSNVTFSQLYRLKYLDAKSVAALLTKTFADIQVTVEASINALSITATAPEQQRIADAIAQLDVPSAAKNQPAQNEPQPGIATYGNSSPDYNSSGVDVITLKAAIPGPSGAASTSATDIATAVTQALQPSLPDLRITVFANQTQLLVGGSPNTIKIARELIEKLDVLPKLVVLDTAIYEVDDTVAKNLGLSFPTGQAVLSTTYTEVTPAAPANGGTAPPLLGLQQFTRTPLSIQLALGLLIQQGKGKVLADPKLTTISGRTASIRAGDNVAILTTTGGSVGTVATTQLQTFQTGVTLDITPVINSNNYITVTLHPTVNNNTGFTNGVPQISTRDAQTTVAMQEGQTLVIGGLIEETNTSTKMKIPLLGDLPFIGPVFTNTQINNERNELIITVTPHVIDPGSNAPIIAPAGYSAAAIMSPAPMATLPPKTRLPGPAPQTPAPQAAASGPSFVAVPDTGAQSALSPYSAQPAATPAPASARAPAANAFVYGTKPAAIPPAGTNDPAKIFYASVSPTSVRNGTPQQIEVDTSANVARVTIAYGAYSSQLQSSGQGIWLATIPFSMSTIQNSTLQVPMTITATRADGNATSLSVPVTFMP